MDEARSTLKQDPAKSFAQAEQIAQSTTSVETRINALNIMGTSAKKLRKFEEAKRHYRQAYEDAAFSKNAYLSINSLSYLADVYRFTKEFEPALTTIQKAIDLSIKENDMPQLAVAYKIQGNIYKSAKNYDAALKSFEEMISVVELNNLKDMKTSAYVRAAQMAEKLDRTELTAKYGLKSFETQEKPNKKDVLMVATVIADLTTKTRKRSAYNTALEYAFQGLKLIKPYNEPRIKQRLLSELTTIYRKLGIYDKALERAIELRQSFEGEDNPAGIASAYTQIAMVYDHLKQYKSSGEFYQKALDIPLAEADKRHHGSANRGKAYVLYEMGDTKGALQYAQKAKSIYSDINSQSGLESTNRLIGTLYSALGKDELALHAYQQALDQARKMEAPWRVASNLLSMSKLVDDKDIRKAEKLANQGVKKAKEIGAKSLVLDGYNVIMRLAYKQRNFEKAYNYAVLAKDISDEISEANMNKRVADLKTANDIYEKERQIELLKRKSKINELELSSQASKLELLNKEHAISSLELERERHIRVLLLSSTVIILLICAVLYARFRYIRKMQLLLHDNNKKIETKNQKLEESNVTKNRFMSIVAHDLRSPISGLASLAEALNDRVDNISQEDLKRYTEALCHQSKQTYNLLEDLLKWLLLQVRNSEPIPRFHTLSDIFSEEIDRAYSAAETKKIDFEINVDNQLKVYVDKNMIKTVVRNLFNNAIKFTRKGGTIVITAIEDDDFIYLHVKDNGVGIPPKDIDRLFEIDQKVSTTGTSGEKGTGFGLALSQEFVGKNGGTISVTSEEQVGSDFCFSMPKKRH